MVSEGDGANVAQAGCGAAEVAPPMWTPEQRARLEDLVGHHWGDDRVALEAVLARVDALEAEKRTVYCIYCNDVRKYVQADDAARRDVLAWMAQHEQECPESPLVRRLKQAEAERDRLAVDRDDYRDRYHETLTALRTVTDERDRLRAAQEEVREMAFVLRTSEGRRILRRIDAALKGPDHA